MNTFTKRLALILAGTLISGAALVAQETATPKREAQVEHRARHQQKRIAKGVKNGQLTPKETAHLEKREDKLNHDIVKAESDGKITKKEQAKLNKEENRDSKKIFRKKHNARTRK
jgi:predicted transglutaminase-like cysteine proteinase